MLLYQNGQKVQSNHIPHKVNKGIFQIFPTPESQAQGDAEARSADISATSTPGKSSPIGTVMLFLHVFL